MREFKRKRKVVESAGIKWHLKALVPADFINCECWPFSMVRIEGRESETDKLRKQFSGPGLKDKRIEEEDKRIAELIFQAFFKAIEKPHIMRAGLGGKFDYGKIKEDSTLHNRLLNEIVALSYGIDRLSVFSEYPIVFRREFADWILALSKNQQIEPWALYGRADDIPAMFNPLRWDFNLLFASYGAEKEQAAMDDLMKKIKGKR